MKVAYRVFQLLLVVTCAVSVTVAQDVKSTPAKAADPIIGTWKLNVAKSRFSPMIQAAFNVAPIKGRTETYRELDGGRMERTETTARADGSVSSSRNIWPLQGGVVQTQLVGTGGPPAISYVETLIGPGDWYVTGIQDGKQITTRHKIVSKDGRTTRQTLKGVTPDGKAFEQLEIYDRQ